MPVYGSKERALEVASMVEPTAVAYNGMFTRGGGFRPGGNVAVFGAGLSGCRLSLWQKRLALPR